MLFLISIIISICALFLFLIFEVSSKDNFSLKNSMPKPGEIELLSQKTYSPSML